MIFFLVLWIDAQYIIQCSIDSDLKSILEYITNPYWTLICRLSKHFPVCISPCISPVPDDYLKKLFSNRPEHPVASLSREMGKNHFQTVCKTGSVMIWDVSCSCLSVYGLLKKKFHTHHHVLVYVLDGFWVLCSSYLVYFASCLSHLHTN